MSFDLALVWESLPRLLEGVSLTLALLALSLGSGALLALPTALMGFSPWRILRLPATAYIYIFRGTPVLVQLFVVYYGVSQFEVLRASPLWFVLREPFWCCVIALGLNSGAYTAEVIRGSIQGVPDGLGDAARALGLSRRQAFLTVTGPLALRLGLPPYGNEVISMLKATALASTVTLLEITGVARTLVAKTFAPYEIFISAAIVYLCLTWVIQRGLGLAERRLNRHLAT